MPGLYDWDLTNEGGGIFLAHGHVMSHPKPSLPDGLLIHTSPVQKASAEGNNLLLTTSSGSQYALRPEDICIKDQKQTSVCLAALGVDAGFVEDCVRARAWADEARRTEAERLLEPGELLLEIIGTTVLNALFLTREGEIRAVVPTVHWGLLQDSVLIRDHGAVDFRYFPIEDRLEPYHASDGLQMIKVRNLGCSCVSFGTEDSAMSCPAGEVTPVPVAEYTREGLFSPAMVNGKSLLSMTHNGKEERKGGKE